MAYALTLVSGVPRMTTIASSGSITIKEEGTVVDANANSINFVGSSVTAVEISPGNVEIQVTNSSVPLIYDEILTVGSTITAGTAVTLPSSGSYTTADLEIFMDGQRLTPVLDYNYVGASPPRTQVTFTFDLVAGDVVKFRKDRNFSDSPAIYDEYLKVVASGAGAGEINLTDAESGDNITLPLSKTYDSKELEVWLNGTRLVYLLDYVYVGVAMRTQISPTFNLQTGDFLRFRVDRPA